MQIGKLQERVWKRSVVKPLFGREGKRGGQMDPGIVFAAAGRIPGCRKPEDLLLAAENQLAARGCRPAAFVLHGLLPPSYEEAALREDMQRFAAAAASENAPVLEEHMEVSAAVSRALYQVTGIGRPFAETSGAAPGLLQPGQELVLTKWIALSGTAALAWEREEELKRRFLPSLLERAKGYRQYLPVEPEARIVCQTGQACSMQALGEGGIFGALWDMAERSGVGLEVDLKRIPVKQETIELCEYFDLNPYVLSSAGALLIGTGAGEALAASLAAHSVAASVIGRVTQGKERILHNGEDVRFLERPQQDEWYRRFGEERREG